MSKDPKFSLALMMGLFCPNLSYSHRESGFIAASIAERLEEIQYLPQFPEFPI